MSAAEEEHSLFQCTDRSLPFPTAAFQKSPHTVWYSHAQTRYLQIYASACLCADKGPLAEGEENFRWTLEKFWKKIPTFVHVMKAHGLTDHIFMYILEKTTVAF